ncbi:MAG TPA: hypothetical protein VI589_13405, partial [Vicinamibacteria bacterium]
SFRLILPGLFDFSGYRAMFRDLLGALRLGREPVMTLERAREDVRIVEAAQAEGPGDAAASSPPPTPSPLEGPRE